MRLLINQIERLEFLRNDLLKMGWNLDVVISDNSDLHLRIPISTISGDYIKIYYPDSPLLTAEENLFFALSNSSKGWVWILGDDDPFAHSTAVELISNLPVSKSNSTVSAVFSNSLKFGNQSGSTFSIQALYQDSSIQEITVQNLIKGLGLIGTTAGFSNWIFNFTDEDLELFDYHLKSPCKIYSHVFFLIEKLFNAKILVRSSPLVSYKLNEHDQDDSSHWISYTSAMNIPQYLPWHLNLLERIYDMQVRKKIDKYFLKTQIEFDHKNNPFNLSGFILGMFLTDFKNRYNSNVLSADHIDRFIYLIAIMEIFPPHILMFIKAHISEFKNNETKTKAETLSMTNLEKNLNFLKNKNYGLLWTGIDFETVNSIYLRDEIPFQIFKKDAHKIPSTLPILGNKGDHPTTLTIANFKEAEIIAPIPHQLHQSSTNSDYVIAVIANRLPRKLKKWLRKLLKV